MTDEKPLATLAATQAPSADLPARLRSALGKALPGLTLEIGESKTDVDVTCPPEHCEAFFRLLRDDANLSFDYLRNIAGVDFEEEGMALKYHLYSFKHGHNLQVTVPTTAGHPRVPSLTSIYAAANWHEREASEMFGFQFDGHPNPKNLLLEEDLHIHPLLKAHPLQKAEILQGIEDGRPGFDF
jgi:NADH-quinone oxidoreductase subunit C